MRRKGRRKRMLIMKQKMNNGEQGLNEKHGE
jgi:hypothetical protein